LSFLFHFGIELGAQVSEERRFRMLETVQTRSPENRMADPSRVEGISKR
jgi:hypothetical protein